MATQEQEPTDDVPIHGYSLRICPSKWKDIVSIAPTGVRIGGYTAIHAKPHEHVILTQMHVKKGLIEKRQNAEICRKLIIKLELETYDKYLWYNHKRKAMMYMQLENASYETLKVTLLFQKLYPIHYRSGIQKQNNQWETMHYYMAYE